MIYKIGLLSTLVTLACIAQEPISYKQHERWWTVNVERLMDDFRGWLGGVDAPSRLAMRDHIKKMGYKTILDVPCGLCTEFDGYTKDEVDIVYYGVDITPQLVTRALERGLHVVQGSIEKIPFGNSSVDVCYARHILEHLDSYEKALDELVRVAAKEVIVVFFLKLHEGEDDRVALDEYNNELLHHNEYSKPKLERYLMSNSRVVSIEWQPIIDTEVALHIYVGSPA